MARVKLRKRTVWAVIGGLLAIAAGIILNARMPSVSNWFAREVGAPESATTVGGALVALIVVVVVLFAGGYKRNGE